jgi:hypothetical protein
MDILYIYFTQVIYCRMIYGRMIDNDRSQGTSVISNCPKSVTQTKQPQADGILTDSEAEA